MMRTTFLFSGFLCRFAGLLFLFAEERACKPYAPAYGDCEYGRYELKLRAIARQGKPVLAYLEARCVVRLNEKLLKAYDAAFTSKAGEVEENYFNTLELPAVQTTVCRYEE